MKAYLTSVFAASVLLSLAQFVLPKGKNRSAASFVLSVAAVVCFVYPALSIFSNKELVVSFDFQNREQSQDENIETLLENSKKELFERAIVSALREENIICERAEVEICQNKIKKASVYLSNLVIDEKFEHINISVITDYVAERLGLEREIVTVYG